jgi:hypothetical protein
MKTKFTALLLTFGFLLVPVTARADDAAVAANQLLVAQMLDGISTRAMLEKPNTFERNPVARAFSHSDLATLGYQVATNVIARVLFRHAPTVVRLLTVLEVGCTVNNVRVIDR